jgi:hypothetical protein
VSNRRRISQPAQQDPASAMITALDGARIPGGCEDCDAYQDVTANADGPGLHKITVRHDDWCPWLAARRSA